MWYYISTGQFGYPQPEDFYEMITYNPNVGCPTCEIGKTQINPFRFRSEPKAKHSQFLGLNWIFDQIFVREQVKHVFEMEKISGIRFSRPVINKTGEDMSTIFQMHVDTILPCGLLGENLGIETCRQPTDPKQIKHLKAIRSKLIEGPFCGQIKYNFPQGEKMNFKKCTFIGQSDIIRTNEWFGSGGSANRPILINQRVKELIDLHKWRGAFLEQIELIE